MGDSISNLPRERACHLCDHDSHIDKNNTNHQQNKQEQAQQLNYIFHGLQCMVTVANFVEHDKTIRTSLKDSKRGAVPYCFVTANCVAASARGLKILACNICTVHTLSRLL